MSLGKTLVVALVLALVVLGLGIVLSPPGSNGVNQGVQASATIISIGGPTGLAQQTIMELRARTGRFVTEVGQLVELLAASGQVAQSSIVIFNSEWLNGKVGDSNLVAFLATIVPKQAKIVAIGGTTSLLFEALNQAGARIFDTGRNPAADNPTLAGYKVRQATAPNGSVYFGDSILISSGTMDSLVAADYIVNWG